MENNYFGKYDNLNDFGYEMVEQGVYSPSDYDIYITDTDKRIIAGEESDNLVDDMSFDDLMNLATDTKSDYEDEKSELEDNIVALQEEIKDLTDLQNSADDDDEYEIIAEQIEEKEIELEDAENSYVDIDSRFEDKAREEARELVYDEIYDRLENDLSSWLEDYGYTSELENVPFLSIDYEKIGDDLSSDYLIVEYDGEMYFFNNYAKGGRITASARKPKYDYYIVENSTKKLVSGYPTKAEASEQRKLLVQQYPSMRFEIYPLANLESKTDLDVYAKKDYVELSTLDKIKKVSVDTFRYGQEKVGQANAFLERNDVKGKIKRGARNVADKTKQGANWLRNKWLEADFGDGKGRAKFFADGGIVGEIYGKNDGGNKIDIYYKTSNGQHHYLGSTNSSKTIKEAVEKYKNTLAGDSQTSFAERKRIDRLEGKFADGGLVGQEIVFDDSGETNTGVIRQITDAGDYVVATDDDRTVLAQKDLDVISLGKMRRKVKQVEEKKGFFSFFENGGGVGEYFEKLENDFSSTRRGGVKNYSVDIDLENGEQLRGGDLDFKDGNDALFLYERIKKKGEYQNQKIEDIQLIANFKNGDYESVDIQRFANGGGVEIAEMPTRERTTITRPTTTPTTTPSKPDKDSPYKPKGIPKPKATKM